MNDTYFSQVLQPFVNLINKSGNLVLCEFLFGLNQFGQIPVLAKFSNYVAIFEAVEHVEAANHILMAQLFQDFNFLGEEGFGDVCSYLIALHYFNSHS